MIISAVLLLGTLVLGLLTCRMALVLVTKLHVIDTPVERSSHERPTPRGGGLGILLAVIPGGVAGWLFLSASVGSVSPFLLLGGVVILAVVGFADDVRGGRPLIKMTLQAFAALLVVAAVGVIRHVALPGAPEFTLGLLALPLTLFWVVGFANAFNFMDGTDGIAALHGGLAALLMGVASLVFGDGRIAWLAFPLAGGCFSFLWVNWSPARVFMGDVGSLPVGALLAALVVLGNRWGEVPFVAGFMMLGPFLFDTLFTLVRRAIRRENLLAAHRSHLYQRLVIAGLSHAWVAVLYAGWTVLTGLLGLLYLSSSSGVRTAALVAALLSGIAVAAFAVSRERKRARDGGLV